MNDYLQTIFEGAQPLQKIEKNARLTSEEVSRDTSARTRFLKSMKLEEYFPKEDLPTIYAKIDKYDAGHLVGRCEGGSNNFDNFIWEEKKENREPGTKRVIERSNQQMLQSGKHVDNTYELFFDKRLPVKVPADYTIKQTVQFRNGKIYNEKFYKMSNSPYLDFVTMPEMRKSLLKYDLKENSSFAVCSGVYGGILSLTTSNQSGGNKLKVAVKIGVKVGSPYIVKGAIKGTLDCLQTSKRLSQETRNGLALLNVDKRFNTCLNNLTRYASFKILQKELGKNT